MTQNIYWCSEKGAYEGLFVIAQTRGKAKQLYAEYVECDYIDVRTSIVKRGVNEDFPCVLCYSPSPLNYADVINSRLTTREVAVRYGLEPNRKGFVCCPFHNEKTASMKIYPDSRGFYCFGCGVGGDTVGLVGKMFDIDYQQALRKLDEDFDLCLYKKPSLTQRRKLNEQIKAEKQQRELLKKQREYSDFAYILLMRYRRWLNRREQTESVKFDIAYVDRLLDRYSRYENLIDFDIWARLNALHSKHRR